MTKVTQLSLNEEGGLGRRRIHLREISGDSETPLETVGQDLRAARLRRGEDLATVSRALKIRKDHLGAVEEDDLEGLPGKTYAIGFVRSYAGYLGLDAAQMVERFKQEISGRHEAHPQPAPVIADEDGRRLPQGWRIVAGVVVLALAYGAWHLLSAGPTQEPVPPPPAINPPPPKPAPAVHVPAAPVASAQTTPAAPTQAAPAANPPASAATATPSPAVPAISGGQGQVFGGQNKNARIVLHARGDTHIEVRGEDGMVYINRTLKAGDSYRVPNLPGLSLAASDAGAVEMELDGETMGRAGAEGQIANQIDLDPQAIVDRNNSR